MSIYVIHNTAEARPCQHIDKPGRVNLCTYESKDDAWAQAGEGETVVEYNPIRNGAS
jgi:hypothetical protein